MNIVHKTPQAVIAYVRRMERIKAEAALVPLAPITRRFADSQHPDGFNREATLERLWNQGSRL